MKILLTGASGLLGSHLLQQGLEQSITFQALTRGPSKRSYLYSVQDHPQIQIINSVDNLEGVDCIINCAAHVSSKSEDQELMNEVNFEAPSRLYAQAHEAGVKFWVQISSIATISNGDQHTEIDESAHGNYRATPYAESKYLLDQWLEQQNKIKTCFIHPCYMIGPYDSTPSSGAILLALKFKKIPALLNRVKNFVAAEDVATAIYSAINRQAQGHYIIGGENLRIKEFIKLCDQKLKIQSDIIFYDELPSDESHPQDQFEFLREFSLTQPVSIKKAQSELGYNPKITISNALDQLIHYFSEIKLLRIK
jgi:dihydroflavonol-4-reductase